jgi:Effector protein
MSRLAILPLRDPAGKGFDSGRRDFDTTNIVIDYDPMPEWMWQSNEILFDEVPQLRGVATLFDLDGHGRFIKLADRFKLERDRYIDKTEKCLKDILRLPTGIALLREISGRPDNVVRIMPDWDHDARAGTDKTVITDDINAKIKFTPGAYKDDERTGKPGYKDDEVLYHELVHASRRIIGEDRKWKRSVNQNYHNSEEYLAIVVTNIYLSDKKQTVFVGDHLGAKNSRSLTGWQRDHFLENSQNVDLSPMQLLTEFRESQPSFYYALAKLPPHKPKFNPVREHEHRSKQTYLFGGRVPVFVSPGPRNVPTGAPTSLSLGVRAR